MHLHRFALVSSAQRSRTFHALYRRVTGTGNGGCNTSLYSHLKRTGYNTNTVSPLARIPFARYGTTVIQTPGVCEESKPVSQWSVDDVSTWATEQGLDKLALAFQQHGIDGEELTQLSKDDIAEICPALGVRKKLLRAIDKLVHRSSSSAAATGGVPPPVPDPSSVSKTYGRHDSVPAGASSAPAPLAPPPRSAQRGNVTSRARQPAYTLTNGQVTPALQEELDDFYTFLTVKFFGQQEKRVGAVTAQKYVNHIKAMLGWIHRYKEVDVDDLSLQRIFPDSSRDSVRLSFEYMQWLVNDRKINPRTELVVIRSLTQLAKCLFHRESKVDPSEGDKPYHDIYLVRELRKMSIDANGRARTAPAASKEELKWLAWPDYLRCVDMLKEECQLRPHTGPTKSKAEPVHSELDGRVLSLPKNDIDVAYRHQVYLICAILACVPDRQRTLRELQVGRTLFKTDGQWVIKHGADDYKTGAQYGDRPPLVISPHIYPYLEDYLNRWRSCLQPQHDYVFSNKKGQPPTSAFIHNLFSSAIYRLTGQRTNPHMVRDMIVTFLRQSGASERDLEALAIYMGHSLAMQKSSYDKRTKAQKVAPAVDLLSRLQEGASS